MTPEQFTYWLQGFVEIRGSAPTAGEWDVIKDHLATVFNKVTPNRQGLPLGPGIAEPYRGTPVTPMPIGPYVTQPDKWTSPPNWTRPEITCSVSAPCAGSNPHRWTGGGGSAVYSHFTNSAIEVNKKLNKDLK